MIAPKKIESTLIKPFKNIIHKGSKIAGKIKEVKTTRTEVNYQTNKIATNNNHSSILKPLSHSFIQENNSTLEEISKSVKQKKVVKKPKTVMELIRKLSKSNTKLEKGLGEIQQRLDELGRDRTVDEFEIELKSLRYFLFSEKLPFDIKEKIDNVFCNYLLKLNSPSELPEEIKNFSSTDIKYESKSINEISQKVNDDNDELTVKLRKGIMSNLKGKKINLNEIISINQMLLNSKHSLAPEEYTNKLYDLNHILLSENFQQIEADLSGFVSRYLQDSLQLQYDHNIIYNMGAIKKLITPDNLSISTKKIGVSSQFENYLIKLAKQHDISEDLLDEVRNKIKELEQTGKYVDFHEKIHSLRKMVLDIATKKVANKLDAIFENYISLAPIEDIEPVQKPRPKKLSQRIIESIDRNAFLFVKKLINIRSAIGNFFHSIGNRIHQAWAQRS
ncbi:hypothetical protein NFC79_02990 [Providencia stuartii]|nr:hypothetical protein NFC79_02990 [Providencia stuartii]